MQFSFLGKTWTLKLGGGLGLPGCLQSGEMRRKSQWARHQSKSTELPWFRGWVQRKGYFWQEFKGREMYGRKKLQKENEANLSRLADSDTTKKFEDEPAERKRLTALRHGKWKILYLIFRVKKRWEEEEVARKEKSRPHLAQFPRHWPAPMLGYWADLGKADNSPVTGAPALPCPS